MPTYLPKIFKQSRVRWNKHIFKYGLGWPWALWSNSIYLLDITKIYSKTRSLFYRSINCFMILMKKSIRFKVCRQCERRMAAVIYLILDNVKVGAVAETENVGLFSPIFWLYSQVCRQWEKEREREIEIGATTIYNVIQYGADSVWLCSRVRTSDKKRDLMSTGVLLWLLHLYSAGLN